MHLGLLNKKQLAVITAISVDCNPEVRQRLLDLGFVKGAEISIQNTSPMGDPIAYKIHNTLISLRREDAMKVLVEIKN